MHFSVQNITKSLPNGKVIFKDISFQVSDVNRNFVLTVTGPSGAGKTTLLKCIAQLEKLDSGIIQLGQTYSDQTNVDQWRKRVLYVPQRPAVLACTPLEFYRTVTSLKSQKIGQGDEKIDPVKVGLKWDLSEDLWSKQFAQLSGGEAQRVMLAIAVSTGPDILLLDGTVNLSELSQNVILNIY
ncbi:P-loop containing nucleoside triphosphate hydrolase protein [Paraphysoderma sedebokerense]|nr:P-loop containing nucleoside triphosphate hydrolase protein [Paraphysoderma sedebokerense]